MNEIVKELIKIAGKNAVLFEKEDLYSYICGASGRFYKPVLPQAVVLPTNIQQVSKIMQYAFKKNVKVTPRCAATGHEGGICPKEGGIVICFSRMNKIIEIDKKNLMAKVEAGVVLGDFQKKVEKEGLFFPPDPSNLAVSMIAGAIALCSGGPRTFKYGTMKDYVLNLKVVLTDGTIIETSKDTIKNVTGYNLTSLFVGSEGTLGIICEATLRLLVKPENKKLVLAYFNSIEEASNAVGEIISNFLTPSTLDLLDKNTLTTIEKFYPSGFKTDKEAALFIELDGENVEGEIKKLKNILKSAQFYIPENSEEEEKLWVSRRSSFGSVAKLKPNVVTEDIAVKRDKIPALVSKIKEIAKKYDLTVCIMGHAGDGNIHPNFALDLSGKKERENFEHAKDELFSYAISIGGTLSGEHGIGHEKSKYLKSALSKDVIEISQKIKNIFDPKGILKTFLP